MRLTEKPLVLSAVLESGMRYVVRDGVLHVYEKDCSKYLNRMRREGDELNVAFHLHDLEDTELDFGGATLVLHGKIQPFLLERCRHVTIRHVSILYERPSFTEMTVLEVGDGFMRVRLNPQHPCRVEDGKLIPYCAEWENTQLDRTCMFLQAFDPQTKQGLGLPLCIIGRDVKPDLPPSFKANQLVAEDGGDGTVVFRGFIHPCYRVGAILALGHEKRVYSSVMMMTCEDVMLENYRVLNGAGMGILPIHTKDIVLRNVQFSQEDGAPGFITNQADAIHAFACSGRFDIIDSVFEGMIDDALNIHSQFFVLASWSGNRMVLETRLHGETSHLPVFCAGDEVGIHRGITTEVAQRYLIRDVRILDGEHIEITVDREVEDGLEAQSLAENLTAQADITIRNCVFRNANSHMRFQSSGRIRIEGCRIALPLLLTGDAHFWFESSGVTDMEIRDTAFVTERGRVDINPQVLPTASEPYYHKNIRFIDCTFETARPLKASMADGILFERTENARGLTMTLELTNCGEVVAPGCILERRVENKDSVCMN